jgi:hypothetical protein
MRNDSLGVGGNFHLAAEDIPYIPDGTGDQIHLILLAMPFISNSMLCMASLC